MAFRLTARVAVFAVLVTSSLQAAVAPRMVVEAAPGWLTSVGDRYHWYVIGAAAIGLLEGGLIAMLMLQRAARQSVQRSLRRQVRFLSLIVELSSSAHRQSAASVDRWLTDWLKRLGQFLGLDHAVLIEERQAGLQVTHSWSADAAPPPPPAPAQEFPWSTGRLRRGKTVRVSRLAELPPEAAADREAWHRGGVRSLLAIPLIERDRTLGALMLTTQNSERRWAPEVITKLRLVGDIFTSVLATGRAERARASSERLTQTLLGVLSGPTAVLDRESRVVDANEGWMQLGREESRNGTVWAPVGASYLEAIGRAVSDGGSPLASEALERIRSVVAGGRREYRLKSESPARQPKEMIVVALRRPEGGAIVSYIDSNDRERAEGEARELRQAIAHLDRVTMLGALSASLAHELNQPLTAILSNVQAARRFLAAEPPNLAEVRDILSDVEEDDRRAGELIRRLRALMRKETASWERVHLRELVRELVDLLLGDAHLRQIAIRLDLDESLPPVRGDRVQLSQVILNLMMNAADAMEHTSLGDRELLIRTWRYDGRSVGLSVRDHGTGIRTDPIERVFEPFYTSKPEGLGVGLPICQTIIQAHGGRIWARNNADRGATFEFMLPVGSEVAQ